MKKLSLLLVAVFCAAFLWGTAMAQKTAKSTTAPILEAKSGTGEILFESTFDDAASFAAEWEARTTDQDGVTWSWQAASWNTPGATDGNTGYVGTGDMSEMVTGFPNDYLFTKSPVKMAAGPAFVSFDWYSMGWYNCTMGIKIYYCRTISTETSDLQEIEGVLCDASGSWQNAGFQFSLPAAGDYYFCFHYYTEEDWNNEQELIFIDNVQISQAKAAPDVLDLRLTKLNLPAASMTVGEETIGVEVQNRGSVDITAVTLSYKVDEGTPVEETFTLDNPLSAGIKTTLTFTEKADFSAPGRHEVIVEIKEVTANTTSQEDPEGNTLSGHVTRLAPHPLPYGYDFSDAADFAEQWIVKDYSSAGGGAEAWAWYADEVGEYEVSAEPLDGKPGVVASMNTIGVSANRTENYLIMSAPVSLPAQKPISLVLNYRRLFGGAASNNNLVLYYGTSPEVDRNQTGLILIDTIKDPADLKWHEAGLEFEVETAGDYYLVIKHDAYKTNNTTFVIDDLEIKEGVFVGTPDVVVENVELPMPSCGLGTEEPISVRLKNDGTATVTKLKLTYTVDNGTPVSDTLKEPLAPGASTTFAFRQKADLSAMGTHTVKVTAEVLESDGKPESETGNNERSASVAKRAAVSLPFAADFTKNSEEREKMSYQPGTWAYNAPRQGMTTAVMSPLQTPCLAFEADAIYRFTLTYRAGSTNGVDTVRASFDLLYGLASEPMSEWKTLKSYQNVFHPGYGSDLVEITGVEVSGDYAVAVMPRQAQNGTFTEGMIYVQSVSVSRKPDYDVRIASVRSSLAALTPVQHAVKPRFEILAKNEGLKEGKAVRVSVKCAGEEVALSEPKDIAVGDSALYEFDGRLNNLAVGDVTFSVEAVLGGSAENQESKFEWGFKATESDYAFDNVQLTSWSQSVGGWNGGVYGQIFTLAEQDTLTSVTIGWAEGEPYFVTALNAMVEVWAVDGSDEVSDCLLAYETSRVSGDGSLKEVELPARVLPAGRYMIGVRQMDVLGEMYLGLDKNPEGVYYILDQGRVEPQSGYYPAVRARFGQASVVLKDIEMLSIRSPKNVGMFSANEPIEAEWRNNGMEAMEVTFKCTVGGKTQEKKVDVAGYASGSVSFEADLSREGSYGILVEAVAEGDENEDNNSVRKSVACVNVDPYVMDFESCEDFTVDNLLPWRSVDVDQGLTWGWWDYKWPHYGEPMGFIAFVPDSVYTPEEDTPAVERIPAHGGDKFGLAISSKNVQNDDWLISPKLTMPAEKAAVSYWVRSIDKAYTETYEVLVSTKTDKLEDFSRVGEVREPTTEWIENTVDLSAYNGKEIYIAFRYTAKDQLFFMIDDISVTKPGQGNGTEMDVYAGVYAFPNPASEVWTVKAPGMERVEIYSLAGEPVYRSAALDTDEYRVNVSAFVSGMYSVRIYTKTGIRVAKLVVR